MERDEGHEKLIDDLKDLLTDAEAFEFHDFKNKNYATPKIALVQRLDSIARRAKEGIYDN